MTALFLPPPFDAPEVLAAILPDNKPALSPARLVDHAAASDADGIRVALVPQAGAGVDGHLVETDAAARERVDFAMAALGARPTVATTAAGRTVTAYVFEAAPEDEPCPGATAERQARLVEAMTEVMGHFGRRAPEEMPLLLHGIAIRALGRARGPHTLVPRALGAGLGAGDVAPEARRYAYARYFGMEEHTLRHRRFDGGQSAPLERAVFTSGDAVTVLPFDPRAGSVLLVEQFRAGIWARRDPRPWCLETVAGRCDRAEPPEATARREAEEEAGLTLGRLERITAFYPSPGIMSEYITAFVGEADLDGAGGTHGLPEEDEDIRALVVPLGAALDAVRSGEINCAPLIISLLWLEANAERLRSEWG